MSEPGLPWSHPTAWLWATAAPALRAEPGPLRCYGRKELRKALSAQKSATHICLAQVILEKVRAWVNPIAELRQ